ncbi:nitric oxide synthase-interacting protein [Trichonephila clavipes]|nr:nitric oxide synthase-interacting protein [Trichonephila clavipes]
MTGHASNNAAESEGQRIEFYCCNLTSQPCKDPVVTRGGFLYERKAVLEYIASQINDIGTRLKAYDDRRDEVYRADPNFLFPVPTKDMWKNLMKPLLCSKSGRVIRADELIDVNFVRVTDPAVLAEYRCAVTRETLGNNVPMAVLRTSGNVVTMHCVERMIKRFMVDPTNGLRLIESDIIPLQRGGTGFSSRDDNVTLMMDEIMMVYEE